VLGFFLEIEKGEGVWGRVRDALENRPVAHSSVISSGAIVTREISKSHGRKIWELWVASQWLGNGNLVQSKHHLRRIFEEGSQDPRYVSLAIT
jgi:hypothetical protein